MIPNSRLKKAYDWYKTRKLNAGYQKIISRKIARLKQKGVYERFPYGKIQPAIQRAPGYNSISELYIDFFYSVLRKPDENFVPVPIYIMDIEPKLNIKKFTHSLQDKNFYDRFFNDIETPETYLRKINGKFYDNAYSRVNTANGNVSKLLGSEKVILKASVDSGGGKNIEVFAFRSGEFRNSDKVLNYELLDSYPDFVIQKFVSQHSFFSQFNPDSNNTLRILTYRSVVDDKIHILHRLLRVGKKGSYLDHDNQGGIVIGMDEGGNLNDFGTDYWGMRVSRFNEVNLETKFKVPFLRDMETAALSIADRVYYSRLLAIDFTVDESGTALLLEINLAGNGTGQYQMNNSSLFGRFTEEIIDYCWPAR